MRSIRRILVAIKDPGAETLPAVAKAARVARACGAHLELFHAMKVSVYADKPATYEEAFQNLYTTQHRTCLQRLGRIAARLKLHDIDVSSAVECDYPTYEVIIRRATQAKADLIVVRQHDGRHAMPGLLRLTDWELLRYSPVPVLLVKRSAPYRHPTILAAVDPCHAHAKPAQLDEQILTVGSQFAAALRGKLHAVHAYPPAVIRGAAASVNTTIGRRLGEIAAANARVGFEELLKGSDIPHARRHLVGDLPASAITTTARHIGADIAVLGALSRSGLKRLFIGNTAESVLDKLPCDLLVVKPLQFSTQPAQPSSLDGSAS